MNFANLFVKKPKDLGEGLEAVKKMFNAVGTDVSKTPGVREYRTICDNAVKMKGGRQLVIEKILQPWHATKAYLGKLAGVTRNYFSEARSGDEILRINRGTRIFRFAEKPDRFRFKIGDRPVHSKFNISKTRDIPYQKAASMGLKI